MRKTLPDPKIHVELMFGIGLGRRSMQEVDRSISAVLILTPTNTKNEFYVILGWIGSYDTHSSIMLKVRFDFKPTLILFVCISCY